MCTTEIKTLFEYKSGVALKGYNHVGGLNLSIEVTGVKVKETSMGFKTLSDPVISSCFSMWSMFYSDFTPCFFSCEIYGYVYSKVFNGWKVLCHL